MSAPENVSRRLVAIAVACLVAAPAIAQQQTQNPGEIKPSQYRDDVAERDSNSGSASQTDRASDQQRDQSSIQLNSQSSERSSTSQPYTANFRGSQRTADSKNAVEQHLAGCLLAHNKAEIEISEFAQQKAQNPEVKQFAEQMISDHQQMSQKLQQIAGKHGASHDSSLDASRGTTTTTTRLPGSPGARATTDTDVDLNADRDAGRDSDRQVNRETTTRSTQVTQSAGGSDHGVLQQLASIEKKIVDQCTQAAKQELSQKSGAEFDECFLAAQINGHMQMLASLEVIGQEAQGELQQVVQDAKPKVQEHLEKAKQLAEQAKAGAASGQAQRPSERTQR
jgi:predicted outer membrane protein